jgi:hypothetical protein
MDRIPTAAELRAELLALDRLDRKVVGGLVALCMASPRQVRDREWLAERFVQVATVAHGFAGEDDAATDDDVERVRLYARLRFDPVVAATLRLFVRTGEDLRLRGSPPDLPAAQAIVAGYLGDG